MQVGLRRRRVRHWADQDPAAALKARGAKAATVPPPDRVQRALSGQMLTLDGVRGVAILLVLAHNLNVIAGPQSRPGHVIDLVDDLGWVGVQLDRRVSWTMVDEMLAAGWRLVAPKKLLAAQPRS